jgi:glucan phosphoethanolaminetransferase (alkaline phosphatase superfamily)
MQAQNSSVRLLLVKHAPLFATIILVLFLLLIEEIYFFPQITYIKRTLPRFDIQFYIISLISMWSSLVLLIAFFWLSFNSSVPYRVAYFLFFCMAVLIQYNYHFVTGRFITPFDFLAGLTSPIEYWIYSFDIFFVWNTIIPALVYLVLLIALRSWKNFGATQLVVLVVIIIFVNSTIHFIGAGSTPVNSFMAFWRTIIVAGLDQSAMILADRQKIDYLASEKPLNNIVLVIDESVRADHLGINGYHRDTTPYLDELDELGLIANWGIAVSAATASIQSNNAIIMGLNALPDNQQNALTNPTIFHYAKAMGYETYYVDAQVNHLWNGMNVSDLQYVDHWVRRKDFAANKYEIDFHVADYVADITKRSVGNFVVINKYGVHFSYESVYPQEAIVWTPIPTIHSYEQSTEIVNSYDNAILYNVDNFFRHLLPDPTRLNNTTFLYTSDHGQTLFQRGQTWFHSGDTVDEAKVPMLLIAQQKSNDLDVHYKASHFNIFATLLDLMNFPQSERIQEHRVSLLKATTKDSVDRYFLGGVVRVRNVAFIDGFVLVNFDED